LMLTDIRDMDAELIPYKRFARPDAALPEPDSGLVLSTSGEVSVGGRLETQSCTRRETRGFSRRWPVFLDDGGVVIMIVGCWEKAVQGRYV